MAVISRPTTVILYTYPPSRISGCGYCRCSCGHCCVAVGFISCADAMPQTPQANSVNNCNCDFFIFLNSFIVLPKGGRHWQRHGNEDNQKRSLFSDERLRI